MFAPSVVACAAIRLAAKDAEIGLPQSWWTLFDVSEEELLACVCWVLWATGLGISDADNWLPIHPFRLQDLRAK